MAPRRTSSSAKRPSKAVNGMSRQLLPYSVSVTPPVAPPPIARNPKRHVVVDIDDTTDAAGLFTLNLGRLRQELFSQTGLPILSQNILIEYVHVWGPTIPSNSELTLTDPQFSTSSEGDGTVTNRARAGFFYPKNVQPYRLPAGSSTTPVALLSAVFPLVSLVTFRVGVTYWGS